MLLGLQILEFVSGYIETLFVPPFIGDWQQLTAEKSVARARKQTYARLVGDIKKIDKNIAATNVKLEGLLATMRDQEGSMRAMTSSPTAMEHKSTIMATYCVHMDTVKKLRKIIHIMARIRAELVVRTTILQTARDALSLASSPDYVKDFTSATNLLLESESQTSEMMRVLYDNETDTECWDKMVNDFIERTGGYNLPDTMSLVPETVYP